MHCRWCVLLFGATLRQLTNLACALLHLRLPLPLQCITAPANVLSEVVVAAYKKFVLVSLILDGQMPMLPKFVSPVVQRQIKASTTAYHDFGNAFKKLDEGELRTVIAENSEAFTKDSNFGLVKQCAEALKQRRIQRLTSTYITLSLQDIAQNAGLTDQKEAEAYVLNMVLVWYWYGIE